MNACSDLRERTLFRYKARSGESLRLIDPGFQLEFYRKVSIPLPGNGFRISATRLECMGEISAKFELVDDTTRLFGRLGFYESSLSND